MTSQALANLSNTVLYVAMGVLAFAMLAFATYTARTTSARAARRRVVDRQLQTVGAGAPAGDVQDVLVDDRAGGASVASPSSGGDGLEEGSGREPGARAGSMGMTLSWLTAMLLLASMALRGLSVRRAPVSNMFEFAVAGSFLVLGIYLVLAQRRPLKWLGLFIVIPVLCVLGLAITTWYTEASELVPSLQSTWLVIHVPIAILSSSVFTLGFVVLLLHLGQARREERLARGETSRMRFLAAMPDSISLDRTAYSLNIIAFPLWTFTLIAGAIWGQSAWGTYWSWDPKEVWTFVIWTIYAAYLHARATSGWNQKRANVIAIVGYVAIIINFTIVNMFFPGMHSYSGLVNQ